MPINAGVDAIYHSGSVVVVVNGQPLFGLSPEAGELFARRVIDAVRQSKGRDPVRDDAFSRLFLDLTI